MTITTVLIVLAGLVLVRLAVAAVRFARLSPAGRRHWLPARWARLRWRWFCRNAGLGYLDHHHRRLLRPRIPGTTGQRVQEEPVHLMRYPVARFRAHDYGIEAHIKTIPKVGRAEFERAAPWLADQFRAHRVQISAPGPGRLRVVGLRRDPLTEPLPPAVLPAAFDGRHLVLGRDEFGDRRQVSLANLSGSVISGNPGQGKTESALSMAVQLVPSSMVDLHVLDGGACDWAPFAAAAATYTDDDLAAAQAVLEHLHDLMMTRRRNLEAELGVRNAWAIGPTPDYRLQWCLIEEAAWFLDLEACKGDRVREAKVRAIRGLVVQLLRRGRAPMFHTTLVVQKATGSGGCPPDIRDLAGLRWCFGCSTTEVAVGGLGDDIRKYESLSPTLLQSAEYVGTATVLLKTGQLPYTLVKFPAIGQDLADDIARAAARPAAAPKLTVVAS
jgi:DNA segregation ATPase FtsK/SpoIIIE, S-DNA-T family